MSDIDNVSKSLSDLIITDTFLKHGVSPGQTRSLTPEQKQQLKDLVQDLKQQVDKFLKVQQEEKQAVKRIDRLPDPPQSSTAPTSPPKLYSALQPKGKRQSRRLGLKKNK
jgi:hypothetical protein